MTEKYITNGDRYLRYLLDSNGGMSLYDHKDLLMPKYNADLEQDIYQLQQQLTDLQLIHVFGGGDSWVRLLPEGFKAAKTGIKAYLDEQERREKIRDRKEEKELFNLEFYAKTKYWPYIIAGLSLIASIVLPILLSQ
jgi:hypothetical protein